MTNRLDLDPEIAALCEDACAWMVAVCACACALGITAAQGIARLSQPIHTGYMPEPQRRSLHHRSRRDGIVTDPPRDRSAERARAFGEQLFGARPRPVLTGEVRS